MLSRGAQIVGHRAVGGDGSHLQLHLVDGRANGNAPGSSRYGRPAPMQALPAIAFRQAQWAGCLPPLVDIAYRISVNHWQGTTSLQLVVEDMRPTEMESVHV